MCHLQRIAYSECTVPASSFNFQLKFYHEVFSGKVVIDVISTEGALLLVVINDRQSLEGRETLSLFRLISHKEKTRSLLLRLKVLYSISRCERRYRKLSSKSNGNTYHCRAYLSPLHEKPKNRGSDLPQQYEQP
jgi:hypothetical protein